MNMAKSLSKLLYICLLLSCFLPAIVPSCSKKSETTAVDSTATVIEAPADTLTLAPNDSASLNQIDHVNVELKADSTLAEEKSFGEFFLRPDNKNYSIFGCVYKYLLDSIPEIIGFVYFYLLEASLSIFFLLSCWAGWLRFRSHNESKILKLSIASFLAMTLFSTYPDLFIGLIWGFWLAYILCTMVMIVNFISYLSGKRKQPS
jgi:hypothetical protein